MDESISAADVGRNFFGVREGQTYVVTSHGRPVARIIPADDQEAVATKAHAVLVARLRIQPTVEVERWTRDELYDD